jgi:hypothetical protein
MKVSDQPNYTSTLLKRRLDVDDKGNGKFLYSYRELNNDFSLDQPMIYALC